MISKHMDKNIYSKEDLNNYAKILVETRTGKQRNNPAETVIAKVYRVNQINAVQHKAAAILIPSQPTEIMLSRH